MSKGQTGMSGEGTGCYNILAMSDDACKTWKEIAYFIPSPKVAAQSVIDPRLVAMPEGRLLILIPVSERRVRRGCPWEI